MFAILEISDICFKSVSYFLLGNFMMPVALWEDSFDGCDKEAEIFSDGAGGHFKVTTFSSLFFF